VSEKIHSYFCIYCHRSQMGETAAVLAANVNQHNSVFHPADCSSWTSSGITHSNQYSFQELGEPTPVKSLPAAPVEITDDDRQMLAKAGIAW
jgi:hypothetical protein